MHIRGNRQYSCKLKFKEPSIIERNPHQVMRNPVTNLTNVLFLSTTPHTNMCIHLNFVVLLAGYFKIQTNSTGSWIC